MTQFMPLFAEWDPVSEIDASKHLLILRQGTAAWNAWRQANPYVAPFLAGWGGIHDADLSGADLSGSMLWRMSFRGVNMHGANLAWVTACESQFVDSDLREAFLEDARLRMSVLRNIDLARATLTRAELDGWVVDVDLSETRLVASTLRGSFERVRLVGADLSHARFVNSRLSQVQFDNVALSDTAFSSTQFLNCTGLERVLHLGACEFGLRTIEDSTDVPLQFWESAGVAPAVAAVARSFKPSSYCSCFISYAVKDNTLVSDVYRFLRSKGVQCWKADRDLLIGDVQREAIFNGMVRKFWMAL